MSLRDALLQPIPGPNRVGDYLRHEPIYDRIKEARREDLDLPQGEWQQTLKKADWPLVIRLTTDALSKQSKDLQLAAWLTEALLRRDGFGGLRDGLDLLTGLLEEFWDDVYPELEDGDAELRAVPLEWLAGSLEGPVRTVPINGGGHSWLDYGQAARVPTKEAADGDNTKREARQKAIAEGKLTPEEFATEFESTAKAWYKELVADLDGAQTGLESLERIGDERFGRDAPSFIKLRTALQEVRQTVGQLLARKLETEPDPVVIEEVVLVDTGETTSTGSPGDLMVATARAAAPAGESAAVTAMVDAPRSLDEASARVAAAARFLRAQSPADPAAYLLLRGYRWGELRRNPREVEPRLLEAPPTELRSRLKVLLLEERWPQLLEAGEELMTAPFGRGWLDLQRYSITACDALGGEYDALGSALRGALRALLEDVPQLASLTLLDDSPTANADTLRWLRAEALIGSGTSRSDDRDEPAVPQAVPSGRDPFDRALGLARQGQMQRAVELLVAEAAREQSERGRFLRRTQAASIMVDAELENVALPILNEVLAQVDAHQLEKWEAGETVALPLYLLYRCIARLNPEDSSLEELYLRICRLDPLRAIHLQAAAQNGDSGG